MEAQSYALKTVATDSQDYSCVGSHHIFKPVSILAALLFIIIHARFTDYLCVQHYCNK